MIWKGPAGLSWRTLGEYLGVGSGGRRNAVAEVAGLGKFVKSRASHVSQSTLYGYLKTRAGTRFPELFENPVMLDSINIAKWHVWLACVSDLLLWVGGKMRREGGLDDAATAALMEGLAEELLGDCGVPPEAGVDFTAARARFLERVRDARWNAIPDDDTVFTESPGALVHWSPIADEFKSRDEEIVENSVRFRWIEVRREARRMLRPELIAADFSARTESA